MQGADPPNTATLKLVVSLIEDGFEHRVDPLRPDTELVALCAGDPEELEWALGALQRSFQLDWPVERDGLGMVRRLQLFLPEKLTLAELCAVVEAGAWPADWTRPGKRFLPFIRP